MELIGEYSVKRIGEPLAKARLILSDGANAPSVSWLYDRAMYKDAACPEVEGFLLEKCSSIPDQSFSITVVDLGWAGGSFSVDLMLEVLNESFRRALLSRPNQHADP